MSLIDRIQKLEQEARKLDPGHEERMALTQHVLAYTEAFLESLPDAPAFQMGEAGGTELHQKPIGELGRTIQEVLMILRDNVDNQGINTPSARHLAYIPGGPLYHAALGDFLADISNRFSGHFFGGPGAVRIENMLLRWMATVVGYPEGSTGNLTSGGSMANLTAILTARDAAGLKARDYERAVVYLTDQAHHSIAKALRIAGLGEAVLHYIPVDRWYRMLSEMLNSAVIQDQQAGLIPWLIVATAGTTDTGAVDPLEAISGVARQHQLWLHVDGAYGAFFALCQEGKQILKGMELSDFADSGSP